MPEEIAATADPVHVPSEHFAGGDQPVRGDVTNPRVENVDAALGLLDQMMGAASSTAGAPAAAREGGVAASSAAAEGDAPTGGDAPAEGAAAPAEKTPAELRLARSKAQLEALTERRRLQRTAERTRLDAERVRSTEGTFSTREQTLAQREKSLAELEASLLENPAEFFASRGKDVGEMFLSLSEAAKRAGTPEAKIDALMKIVNAQNERHTALETALKEREATASKRAIEADFMSVAQDTCKVAQIIGLKGERLTSYADEVADRMVEEGKRPTYASIAQEIETEANELALSMLDALDFTLLEKVYNKRRTQFQPGDKTELAAVPGAKPPVPGAVPPPKTKTISNDLATSTGSAKNGRIPLRERQKLAANLIK